MSELVISDLHAGVSGREILRGVDLVVRSGEVHAVMGPNGSGKSTLSHVLMGKPGYEVTAGTVTLDGVDLLELPTWKRAQAGLFLAMQYPIEVPGVALDRRPRGGAGGRRARPSRRAARCAASTRATGSASIIASSIAPSTSICPAARRSATRHCSSGFSRPRIAVLDEIDSGLDIDALRAVSRRIEEETNERGLGVLAITHYSRLLHELRPDHVHVLIRGRIERSGGPDLAMQLESTGYSAFGGDDQDGGDPFAGPH